MLSETRMQRYEREERDRYIRAKFTPTYCLLECQLTSAACEVCPQKEFRNNPLYGDKEDRMKKIYVDEEAKFHDSDPVLGDIVVRLDDKHVHLFISERYWCWHLEDSDVMSKGTCPE